MVWVWGFLELPNNIFTRRVQIEAQLKRHMRFPHISLDLKIPWFSPFKRIALYDESHEAVVNRKSNNLRQEF
jgi:hypothetical protein